MKKIFKCEGCGGEINFDPKTQCLICKHCNSKTTISDTIQPTPHQVQYSTSLNLNKSLKLGSMYKCMLCETKFTTLSGEVVSRCPSCGNKDLNEIHESQLYPMNIIPFKITKKEASKCYKKWLGYNLFSPNNLKKMAKQQKITGFYVPVYMFDFDSTTHYSAKCVTYDKSNLTGKEKRRTRYVTDVEKSEYDDYLYSANRKIDAEIFRKMGGFKSSGIVPYSHEYILGFLGLGTNRTIHSSLDLTEKEIAEIEKQKIENKLPGSVDFLHINTKIDNIWCDYLYVPVWSNHYTYKGKNFHCYINGQTGKVTGKTPISFWKVLGFTATILTTIGAIALLFI